jgi:hypothetical protein
VVAAHHLNGGRGTIGYVAIDGAIAVVHGADELARTALFAFALVLRRAVDAVAGLGRWHRTLLEKLLLLPGLVLMVLVALLRSLRGRLLRSRLCGLRRLLHLRLLALRRALLARFVLAAAAAAAMPLRRRLTVVRSGPHFRLGLSWFCRHAYTSWNDAA